MPQALSVSIHLLIDILAASKAWVWQVCHVHGWLCSYLCSLLTLIPLCAHPGVV